MKYLLLILILTTASCTGSNFGAQSANNAATLACNTAELAADVSGNQNMAKASSGCLKAVEQLNSSEFQTVISAAGCVYKHCGNKTALRTCLRGINWAPVAAKIYEGF